MRVVHAYHEWWPEAGLSNKLQALPHNDSPDWNVVSGEWSILDNLQNIVGRDWLPLIDDRFSRGVSRHPRALSMVARP
jgi:hypothetical protein